MFGYEDFGDQLMKVLQSIDGRLAYLCQLTEAVYEKKDTNRHDTEKGQKEVNQYIQQMVGMFKAHPAIMNDPKAQEILKGIPNIGGSE
jgi:hypothetical protein